MDSALQLITNSKFIVESLTKNRSKGSLSKAGAELIDKKGQQSTTPATIKQEMGKKYSIFYGYGQQDCQEFVCKYLESVHREQNEIKQKPPYKQMEYNNLTLQQAFEQFRNYQISFETSDLQRHLQFYVLNERQCDECDYKSISFLAEESLVVDCESLFKKVKCQQQQPITQRQSMYSWQPEQKKSTTLQKCFEEYFQDQEITDCKCPQCKKTCTATMKRSLWTVPDQLIIMFKRFNGRFSKIDHTIQYNEVLSLKPYMHAESVQGKSEFEINAVCLHSGGCGGGHYTVYVRGLNGQCYYCNDSSVQRIDKIDYNDSRAYVLSYSKKDE